MFDSPYESQDRESQGQDDQQVEAAKPPDGVLQRKGDGALPGDSRSVAAGGFKGPSMDLPYRSEMEQGFGVSFDGVRAYGGGPAAQANSQLGSEAYTVGQQVAFKHDKPGPDVVAHELAHTLQQGGNAAGVQTWAEGSPGDSFESEANNAAATVIAGGRAKVSQKTGPTLSKWGGSDHYTIGNLAGQKALGLFATQFPGADAGTPRVVLPEGADGSGPLGGGIQEGTVKNPGGEDGKARPDNGIQSAEDQGTLGVKTNAGLISFGAASRFGGDYETTVGGLAKRKTELGGTVGAGGGGWVSNKMEFAAMAIGGTTNANHFFPVNGAEYSQHHAKAMSYAGMAHQFAVANMPTMATSMMSAAMQEEGFANHFLQDTFSSGHMVPRSLDSTEHLAGTKKRTLTKVLDGGASVIEKGTGAVTGGVAAVGAGGAGATWGGVKGFFGKTASDWWGGNFTNPFSNAASGAVDTAKRWGGAGWDAGKGAGEGVAKVATKPIRAAANAPGFIDDAAAGLQRTKQWHDFFCALPQGLPTSRGRFHGDYYMDGNDLEIVSNTCANSIYNVLAAGQGKPGNRPVQIPQPDFAGIMADPQAGPVWRLMMRDYKADLEKAENEIDEDDVHKTDGGSTMKSKEIIDQIKSVAFGGEAGIEAAEKEGKAEKTGANLMATVNEAASEPLGTVNERREGLHGAIANVQHYASTHFGYNANLAGGKGLDDDLNAPDKKTAKDPDVVGFDPVQIEATFQVYTHLSTAAKEFALAATVAVPSVDNKTQLEAERDLAWTLADKAGQWAKKARKLIGVTDTIKYGMGHGTISSDKEERMALRADVLMWLPVWLPHFVTPYSAKVAKTTPVGGDGPGDKAGDVDTDGASKASN